MRTRAGVVSGVVLLASIGTVGAVPALGQTAPALDDARIAHIAVTANAIDVDMAQLADSLATDTAVRAFAERMITDHTGVNQAAAALAKRLGLTPQDNDVSRSLRSGEATARSELLAAEGPAFDRAYIDHEVAYHEAVLKALDDTLIPGASNTDLSSLLKQARGAVAAHLARAEEIRASLENGQ